MNIGFDAKRAFLNTTGLGNYSRTFIDSFIQFFPENKYFLFTPEKGNLYQPEIGSNTKIISPSSLSGKLFKAAWRTSWIKLDIAKNEIDIYHGLSHEIPLGLKDKGIKSVVTIHDLIHEKFPEYYKKIDSKIYTKKFRYACLNADKIIAISEQTKKDIIDLYRIDAKKIEVIYQSGNSVFSNILSENEKREIRNKYKLPNEYLLSVGSIIERKNLLNVIKALQHLPNVNRIPLFIVGQGKEYKHKIVKFIQENKLENQIRFLSDEFSSIPNEDLPGIYQNSKALIYTSLYEGFGLPVLEGIMSNVPVLTSAISSMPEAGGDVAFYCDPSKPESIAEQIQIILTNPSLVNEKSAQRENHLKRFEAKILTEKMMKLYQSM